MQEPLAFRMRPTSLDDIVGQQHLVNENGFIRKLIDNNKIFSMILFGPPGTGKTTIAKILAESLGMHYRLLNATTNNKKDIEIVIEEAKMYKHLVVIIDEIHRLNKDKQDILLPHIENGLITLIGATTSNPYHSINKAIRSRCHLVELNALSNEDILQGLKNALTSEKGLNNQYKYDEEALNYIAQSSSGDIRFALNQLEICSMCCKDNYIDIETVKNNLKVPQFMFDNNEDGHYDSVSAFQKSIRGGDVDAALYYLARLIIAEDMDSIERRLLVIAYEDIGLGNPYAVDRVFNAIQAAKTVGFPEAQIPLSFAVIDLCLSPHSRLAADSIEGCVEYTKHHLYEVPQYLKYTPVGLKEEEKYPYDGRYIWPHLRYLPSAVNEHFLKPWNIGKYEQALMEQYKNSDHSRSDDIPYLRKKYHK